MAVGAKQDTCAGVLNLEKLVSLELGTSGTCAALRSTQRNLVRATLATMSDGSAASHRARNLLIVLVVLVIAFLFGRPISEGYYFGACDEIADTRHFITTRSASRCAATNASNRLPRLRPRQPSPRPAPNRPHPAKVRRHASSMPEGTMRCSPSPETKLAPTANDSHATRGRRLGRRKNKPPPKRAPLSASRRIMAGNAQPSKTLVPTNMAHRRAPNSPAKAGGNAQVQLPSRCDVDIKTGSRA
jgi:hypothetical protein